MVLVRHAHAGDKHRWAGPDEQRPLSRRGRAEVQRLAPVLRLFRPARVVSASVLRCRETVAGLGVPVELCTALDETSPDGLPAPGKRCWHWPGSASRPWCAVRAR